MTLDPITTFARLGTALVEIDVVRSQLREAQSTTRTSRFYRLVRLHPLVSDAGVDAGYVIELSGGHVLLNWLHDPFSVSLYTSINSLRIALQGTFRLELDDVSERKIKPRPFNDDSNLNQHQRRVLALVLLGLTNKQIAIRLKLSESTVKNYLSEVYRKLGVEDRIGAVMIARDWDLSDNQQEPGD